MNLILKLTLLGTGICSWLAAAPLQRVEVVTTQREALAAGGVIRLTGTSGELNVEGWARPEIEIELTRSKYCDDAPKPREAVKQELDRIQVAIRREGSGEWDVSTVLPKRRFSVSLNYRIHVPRDAKLIVHHNIGDVLIHDMTGAIEASARVGDIVLQMDGTHPYSIDAKSGFGDVYSEFSGAEHQRHLIGQSFAENLPAPSPRIYLRVRLGGIKIQKIAATVY